jgi:hypothetical protein
MSYLKNKMGGGKTLAPYIIPETTVLTLQTQGIICESNLFRLSALEEVTIEDEFTW